MMRCLEICFVAVLLIAIFNGVDTKRKFPRPTIVKKLCQKRNMCQNGGTCVTSAISWMHCKCKCPIGYYGRRCDKKHPKTEQCDTDHCASSPCKYNGTCTSGPTTFSCQCEDGYKGSTCEVFIDHCASSPCRNNGTCTSGPTSFSCQCEGGYKGNTCEGIYKSCMEILQSNENMKGQDGVYPIQIDGNKTLVYCDMTTDGGGWTDIQKRKDAFTDFYQTWDMYKRGFGDPALSYWIGNDAIHSLTKANDQELRVDISRSSGKTAHASYSTFYIGNETSKYILTVEGFSGTAGNSMLRNNGRMFSTFDQDNDEHVQSNCAVYSLGAWWYSDCGSSNLNGRKDVYWLTWTGATLNETVMMIRPKQ